MKIVNKAKYKSFTTSEQYAQRERKKPDYDFAFVSNNKSAAY